MISITAEQVKQDVQLLLGVLHGIDSLLTGNTKATIDKFLTVADAVGNQDWFIQLLVFVVNAASSAQGNRPLADIVRESFFAAVLHQQK